MKKVILFLSIFSSAAFAGNSDVGSSTSSLKCRAGGVSAEYDAVIAIKTAAFNVSDYSGPAEVSLKGMSQSFWNISTKKSVYIKLENNASNPAFIVPLQSQGDGQIILYFNDPKGQSARLVYRSPMDEKESILAHLVCK